MADVYHLVSRAAWEARPEEDYRADSLDHEGFIHCSYAHQVESSANRHHARTADLILLRIDPSRLSSPFREDPAGSGELFPHIHGPLNRSAVVSVLPMARDSASRWVFVQPDRGE